MFETQTPPWVAFFAFLLAITPVAAVLAFVLSPYAAVVLLSFYVTATLAYWTIYFGAIAFAWLSSPGEQE